MVQAAGNGEIYPHLGPEGRPGDDLIRGKDVNQALAALQFSRKAVARDVAKVLRSAVANAQQKEGFGGEVDRLFVSKCLRRQRPVEKRVRPAPMGRAFRIVKRTTHLTVEVTERPQVVKAVGTEAPRQARGELVEIKKKKPAAAAAEG